MIDWESLWVGDELWDIEHNRIVRFKSKKGNVISVNYGDHTFIRNVKQLRSATDAERNTLEDYTELTEEVANKSPSITDPGNRIDLHLEKLPHYIQQADPTRLLDLKIKHLEKYLNAARKNHHKIITIIHGKGTGILKQEVLSKLKAMEGIRFVIPTQDGGATEVWFD